MPHSTIVIPTPLGVSLLVGSDGDSVVASQFARRVSRRTTVTRDALLREVAAQVRAYFARRLRRFDLPYRFAGTPFQCAVWRCVSELETGDVVAYADIARAIGHPRSHRGVAAAMGAAPLDLFVPAHRVVGADGRIKGAAPQSMRRRLLAFEGVVIRG